MLSHLDREGYAIIKEVASPERVLAARQEFWACFPNFDRTSMEDWNFKWRPDSKTGICSNLNHTDFLWNTRLLPRVKQAFARIWGSDDLITSFDTGNAFRPWAVDPNWLTSSGWWHIDQNSLIGKERQGRVCVQGLVTYYDADALSGGLCLIPRSHLQHDEVCKRSPAARMKIDFVRLEDSDPILVDPILVCAKAGDLLLWDSRTIHCNTPGIDAPRVISQMLPQPQSAALEQKAGQEAAAAALGCVAEGEGASELKEQGSSRSEQCSTVKAKSETGVPAPKQPQGLLDSIAGFTKGALRNAVTAAGQPGRGCAVMEEKERPPSSSTSSSTSSSKASDIHSSSPLDVIRLAAYVCMVPTKTATREILSQRLLAFQHGMPSSHWPTQNFPSVISYRNLSPCRDLSACPPEMLSLVSGAGSETQTRSTCSTQ